MRRQDARLVKRCQDPFIDSWSADLLPYRVMGRPLRAADGGYVYHVLNRANARLSIFESDGDYQAFENILAQAVERTDTRLLAYCLMPNHWHLLVWPRMDGELSRFIGWLTLTHTQRWHAHRHAIGSGHLYQGRFKSFPIQQDEHFYSVARYVERNAMRANLVRRAELWPYGSLYRWLRGTADDRALLTAWPLPRKASWVDHVNEPLTELELAAIRRSVNRGAPLGDASWVERAVRRLNLQSTLRPRGRPKKQPPSAPASPPSAKSLGKGS
jgi:putative transposase